ncbi:hypothetical protein GEMRC1_004644 [Eukaryota sp. GEM-RC1]
MATNLSKLPPNLRDSPLAASLKHIKHPPFKTPRLRSTSSPAKLPQCASALTSRSARPPVSARSSNVSSALSSISFLRDTMPNLMDSTTNEETNKIKAKATKDRQRNKSVLLSSREEAFERKCDYEKTVVSKWKKRTHTSPFLINLVADTERIDEEVKVAENCSQKKRRSVSRAKEAVKDILFQQTIKESVDHDLLIKHKSYEVECLKLKPVMVTSSPKVKKNRPRTKSKDSLAGQHREILNVEKNQRYVDKFKELNFL